MTAGTSPLANLLNLSAIREISTQFGESEQSISRGIQSSTAAVVSGLARGSKDSGFLDRIMQLASKTPESGVSSALANGDLAKPGSSFLASGTQFLSTIFGGQLSSVVSSLSGHAGLRTGVTSALLALAGQSILGYIGGQSRSGGMTAAGLAGFLQKESANLQGMLPAGFGEMFSAKDGGPQVVTTTRQVEVNPVIAQAVKEEPKKSFLPWLLGLLLAALLLGFLWYRSQSHEQPEATVAQPAAVAPVPVATPAASALGEMVDDKLPNGTDFKAPMNGVEGKLLAFIQDSSRHPDKTTWFDFDRLLFDTGSSNLQPQSQEQLHNIADIMKAYPAVHLTIGGYTDNTGDKASNLKLSQDRANSVTAELVSLGVDKSRLVAKGYGEEHPVGDNSTEDGRLANRRISMLVTKK
jgi:OOP family OmpA-OmpF porin